MILHRHRRVSFYALATALVLGYLLRDARADISREENFMLPRSRNCAAIELHPDR